MTIDAGLLAAAANPAVVVFREGVEAVLILAALSASFRDKADRPLRRALWAGVGIAALTSLVTWVAAASLLSSLRFVGQALDAVVSVVAVAILLLITNWFFHRVYWTGWVSGFHARKRRWLDAGTGQVAGMVLLGFTSTYREGFETVLFLHTLGLQGAGAAIGLGAAAGVVAVGLVGLLVLGLQLRLPHRRMLVATGLMISFVLVVMVGNTMNLLQRLTWIPVDPLPWLPPAWANLWLGINGTVEGLVAQVAAAAVVFGSYWLAERYHRGEAAKRAAWRRLALVGALATALVVGWTGSTLAHAPQAPASYRVTIDTAVTDSAVALVPDCAVLCGQQGSPGGALDFDVPNPAGSPVEVVSVQASRYGCPDTYGHIELCDASFLTDRNPDGSTAADGASGGCWVFAHFRPQDTSAWPLINPGSTLRVRGTDQDAWGTHFVHLDPGTPAGCVGARYQIKLFAVLRVAVGNRTQPEPLGSPEIRQLDLGS